jgi:D-arabinose 1-dehydrogenase-like Zn-dependent alcohol dehydrogenase
VHQKHRDIALGHEGAGVIVQVGPDVKKLKVFGTSSSATCATLTRCMFVAGTALGSDCVGFFFHALRNAALTCGAVRGTCGNCRECFEGEDVRFLHFLPSIHDLIHAQMYCATADLYAYPQGDPLTGSLASHAFVRETFAFLIPASMPSAHAAPFMCAGASCFEPLLRLGVRVGERVGVLGLGGLGHMAVQLARAMGCVVVVLSSSEGKREEAMKLGAHEFVVTKGVAKLEGVEQIRHLLVVSSAPPDWRLCVVSSSRDGGGLTRAHKASRRSSRRARPSSRSRSTATRRSISRCAR